MIQDAMIRLEAASLWSKWGFKDGDILSDLPLLSDPHELLFYLVSKYLLPLVDKPISLQFWQTCHNPCRLSAESDELYPDLEDDCYHIGVDLLVSFILEEDRQWFMRSQLIS